MPHWAGPAKRAYGNRDEDGWMDSGGHSEQTDDSWTLDSLSVGWLWLDEHMATLASLLAQMRTHIAPPPLAACRWS